MNERFRQLEMVGCGAMAEVFRGALIGEHGTSRQVAIKRLRPELRDDPSAVDLFVNEARIAVRLDHPNVVHALELTRDDEGYALMCEWLDCASLQQICDDGNVLPTFAVIHVGRSVCNALDYLHSLTGEDGSPLGLVHRDVTPANVFITQSGQVKLADFGVAWCAGEPGTKVVAGTPAFAAPEQKADNHIDHRVDIFGLAATLQAVADELPDDLATVLARACAEDRDGRFADADELHRALDEVSGGTDSSTASQRLAELMLSCTRVRAAAPRLDGAVQSILGDALSSRDIKRRDTDPGAHPESGAERRRWPWVSAAAVVAGVVIGWALWPSPGDAVSANDSQPIRVLDTATPESVVQPAPEPATPTTIPNTPIEPVPRPPPRVHKATTASGMVNLNTVPWARVKIDGEDVGNTPVKGVSLTAGRHRVTLYNPAQKLRREVVIHVDADRVQVFLIKLRHGTVDKRTLK